MDFEQYRQQHESEIEWGLKKRFLDAHADRYTEINRLLCMASCFINVELYGVTYPQEVMLELKETIEAIYDDVQAFRRDVKARNEVQFVKASEGEDGGPMAKSGKNSVIPSHSTNTSSLDTDRTSATPRKTLYGGFLSAGDGTGADLKTVDEKPSTNDNPQLDCFPRPQFSGRAVQASTFQSKNSVVPNVNNRSLNRPTPSFTPQRKGFLNAMDLSSRQNIISLSKEVKKAQDKFGASLDSVSILSNAQSNSQVKLDMDFTYANGECICTLKLGTILIASSNPFTTKKAAKSNAYQKAITFITEDIAQEITMSEQRMTNYGTGRPNRGGGNRNFGTLRRKREADTGSGLEGFFLYKGSGTTGAAEMIQSGADVSKISLVWDYAVMDGGARCLVYLRDNAIADAAGNTKPEAKKAAAEMALKLLQQQCWTIVVKQIAGVESLSRGSVLEKEGAAEANKLASGIGGKLLKMMGWSGGGIGKHEQGIAEPITVKTVIHRQGLGGDDGADITPKIKKVIEDFLHSDEAEDLVFSSDFSKEERAKIHNICNTYNVKSQSYGKGADRQMVISQRRTAQQLFDFIQSHGGETKRYCLIPPSSMESSDETSDFL